jgi:hypothetical protein
MLALAQLGDTALYNFAPTGLDKRQRGLTPGVIRARHRTPESENMQSLSCASLKYEAMLTE